MRPTFEQFQATGRAVDDLRTVADNVHCYECKTPGRAYALDSVIEESGGAAGGCWHLVIANGSALSDDLQAFEHDLYDYLLCEGLTRADCEQALIDEFRAWCDAQGLPQESADDMLAVHTLTAEQRAYLARFCARWDTVVR